MVVIVIVVVVGAVGAVNPGMVVGGTCHCLRSFLRLL